MAHWARAGTGDASFIRGKRKEFVNWWPRRDEEAQEQEEGKTVPDEGFVKSTCSAGDCYRWDRGKHARNKVDERSSTNANM